MLANEMLSLGSFLKLWTARNRKKLKKSAGLKALKIADHFGFVFILVCVDEPV